MRSLSVSLAAMLLASPVLGQAQTAPEPKKNETQPSQQVVTPEPAKPAAPAVAVYGTFNVNTQWTRATGATRGVTGITSATTLQDVAPRLGVSTDSTNFGVRAQLPFAPWGKAIAQCETSANVDGINVSGICNRNSQLGISGAFGTVFFGNWDTPFKSTWYGTKVDDPFGNTDVFDRAGIMGVAPFNVKSSAWKAATDDTISGFNLRAQNSIAYWTPAFMGLSAKVQYGTNEFKSANGAISPKLWSANVVYDNGPLSIVGSYENHEWGFGLSGFNAAATTGTGALAATRTFGATAVNNKTAHTEDYAWRVGAGYELKTPFGATTPNFVLEQVKFMQGAGAAAGSIKEYNHYAWSAALKHRAGAHELRARWDRANAGGCTLVGGARCDTTDFGATQFTVGYAYYLAAPTQIYLTWTQIRNEANAQYTFATAGVSAVSSGSSAGNPRGTTLPGQDPQALALGIRHAF